MCFCIKKKRTSSIESEIENVMSLNNHISYYRQKLPINPMDRGVLTDGADYIFLDGRPTPFGMKQKRKLLLQREYAVS